ncbi:MAG TPA: winged helix-turn-helix domain-containing protein, partial [Cellvibrionaceae bacterium]
MPKLYFSPFIFDPATGELAGGSEGTLVLRHKVALLLTYLIEHRTRLVSKEELLDALWQHGDYRERSLTQSIRELRKVLGDNAADPGFIRTYPQRGYQWVAPLDEPRPTVPSQVVAPTRWHPLALLSTLVLGVMLLVGVWFLRGTAEPAGDEKIPSLVVLPFANDTGDPAQD